MCFFSFRKVLKLSKLSIYYEIATLQPRSKSIQWVAKGVSQHTVYSVIFFTLNVEFSHTTNGVLASNGTILRLDPKAL